MNLSIFEIPDPSGKMSKETFLLKNYPEEYFHIIDFCQQNNLDVSFKERVYLAIHNIFSIPVCKNPNCNNFTHFRNFTLGYREYCSTKCISSDPNIKKIKEEKSFEKFGTKSPAQSIGIRNKIIKTNLLRYGGNSPMSSNETKNKNKETIYDRYGVDNVSKVKDFLDKRIASFKENIDQYKESYRKTSLHRYGTSHPWNNPIIHHKGVESMRESKNFRSLEKIREKMIDFPEYKLVGIDGRIGTNVSFRLLCPRGHEFVSSRTLIYKRWISNSEICIECNPINQGISGMEIIISNFIKDNYFCEISTNTRKIIPPFELDIYMPDPKIGFEVNGLYWHSSENKDKNYHKKKYDLSIKNGISVYTIWEDDWIFKTDICKSFMLNKIGRTPNRIYARKCEVREISYLDSMNFLNSNHFQGDIKSPIRLGLFFQNELVSLMTFGNLRLALSQISEDKSYELTRFCNKNYTTVIGGASKLLNHFIKMYFPKKIISYSDNSISNGGLYEKLGFKYSHTSNPGYWYNIDGIRSHRFNWRKSKLVKMGYDSKKTEEEIMNELGYYRIYNSGNKKWILEI